MNLKTSPKVGQAVELQPGAARKNVTPGKQETAIQFARWFERAGHPAFLAGALMWWWAMGMSEAAVLVALILALLAMEVLERLIPAVPRWRQTGGEKLKLIGVYLLILLISGVVIGSYEALLFPLFLNWREGIGTLLWPHHWPILAQILMLYFLSDFIFYWIHRAIHRSALLWRISGHGFHHAFHNLHAINVAASHPFELFFLLLPMVLLAALFGVADQAVAGALVLIVVNGTLAHSNIRMATPIFNWFFTASNQHRRHHSVEFEVSNTNYACNAIVWDRMFGTYSEGSVDQTGIGPRQPGFVQMFLLPFREPSDVDTVSKRSDQS